MAFGVPVVPLRVSEYAIMCDMYIGAGPRYFVTYLHSLVPLEMSGLQMLKSVRIVARILVENF